MAVRSFSTTSRPALRAAACGGRPRPAGTAWPKLQVGPTPNPHSPTVAVGIDVQPGHHGYRCDRCLSPTVVLDCVCVWMLYRAHHVHRHAERLGRATVNQGRLASDSDEARVLAKHQRELEAAEQRLEELRPEVEELEERIPRLRRSVEALTGYLGFSSTSSEDKRTPPADEEGTTKEATRNRTNAIKDLLIETGREMGAYEVAKLLEERDPEWSTNVEDPINAARAVLSRLIRIEPRIKRVSPGRYQFFGDPTPSPNGRVDHRTDQQRIPVASHDQWRNSGEGR
jgi:hypothetical protein